MNEYMRNKKIDVLTRPLRLCDLETLQWSFKNEILLSRLVFHPLSFAQVVVFFWFDLQVKYVIFHYPLPASQNLPQKLSSVVTQHSFRTYFFIRPSNRVKEIFYCEFRIVDTISGWSSVPVSNNTNITGSTQHRKAFCMYHPLATMHRHRNLQLCKEIFVLFLQSCRPHELSQ